MSSISQKVLIGCTVAFVLGAFVFGLLVLKKLERIVQVSEKMDARVEHIMEAAAPVGKAAVEKGVQVLESVDSQELGQRTTDGIKEIGGAAKKRVLDYVGGRKADEPEKVR